MTDTLETVAARLQAMPDAERAPELGAAAGYWLPEGVETHDAPGGGRIAPQPPSAKTREIATPATTPDAKGRPHLSQPFVVCRLTPRRGSFFPDLKDDCSA